MPHFSEIRVETTQEQYVHLNPTTCAIRTMYLRQLHPLTTQHISRLIIMLGEPPQQIPGTIYTVKHPFDFQHYTTLDHYHKKKSILDIIHTTMMQLSKAENIDQKKLQAAYNHCLEQNLEHRWQTPYKPSPSQDYHGAIAYHWEVDYCQATAIITDTNKQIQATQKLFQYPAEFLSYSHQTYSWESPTSFFLESVNHFNGREFATTPLCWKADVTKLLNHT